MKKNKIFVACDTSNIPRVKSIIKKSKTSKLKIGYSLYNLQNWKLARLAFDNVISNYPNMILDYSQLGNVKLGNFSQLDIRFDKKWNKEKISINFFIEILNLLSQKIPTPPEYGLQRDNVGNIITPFTLVEVDVNRESIIPSFGFSIDF